MHSSHSALTNIRFNFICCYSYNLFTFFSILLSPVYPTFTTNPKDTLVQEKKKVILTCAAKSLPPSVISWIRNNKLVIADGNHTIDNNDTLTIKYINPHEAGMYQCIARHPSMFTELSRRANITVLGKNTIRI
jgi:hypothetical protein